MMTKILSNLYIDFPKWGTYVCLLGAVKLKYEKENPLLDTGAVTLGEFSIRPTAGSR